MKAHDVARETAVDDTQAGIAAGRAGSAEARGRLFEMCRDYLLLVAERRLDPRLRGKLGASDLVQQTFLDAERGFAQFRGETDQELHAWLCRILENRAGQANRRYRRVKRDVRHERSLAVFGDNGSGLQAPGEVETPSRQMASAEEVEALTAALARLPRPYQQVIQLRQTLRKSFEEIGLVMDRSADAARKLWARAVEQLRLELDTNNESRSKRE